MSIFSGWRSIGALAATGAFCLMASSNAEAALLSYDYTFDPIDDVLMDNNRVACTGDTVTDTVSGLTCQSLEFTYGLAGFNPATDTLASASLTLTFYDDDSDQGNQQESVEISLDGVLAGGEISVTSGSTAGNPFSLAFDVRSQLADGLLTVLLELGSSNQGNNDFFFASSRLVADGARELNGEEEDRAIPAPEPASLLLFGIVAAGLAARPARRREA
jgi:hypothetical protein